MRLDKFICKSTNKTRNEAKRSIRFAMVKVDGKIIKSSTFDVQPSQTVTLDGNEISLIGERYIMLHKPEDMICSNIDEVHPSVLNLVNIPRAFELNIAGRLDVDTTGLVLLSDNGQWTHKITSPKRKCSKVYRAILVSDITDDMINELETGVQLHNEPELTLPAKVNMIDKRRIELSIVEGKYHQVKRMLAAVGNKVIELHRLQISDIVLDDDLEEGQWRYLTEQEIACI